MKEPLAYENLNLFFFILNLVYFIIFSLTTVIEITRSFFSVNGYYKED